MLTLSYATPGRRRRPVLRILLQALLTVPVGWTGAFAFYWLSGEAAWAVDAAARWSNALAITALFGSGAGLVLYLIAGTLLLVILRPE